MLIPVERNHKQKELVKCSYKMQLENEKTQLGNILRMKTLLKAHKESKFSHVVSERF